MRVTIPLTLALALFLPCHAQPFEHPPFPSDEVKLGAADLKQILHLICPGQEFTGQTSGCHVVRSEANGHA